MNVLPINTDILEERPDRFRITIGDKRLVFRITYNTTDKAIYADIFDNEGVPLVQGRKLVYGVDLLGTTADDRLPVAVIVPVDFTGEYQDITLDNLMDEVLPVVIE